MLHSLQPKHFVASQYLRTPWECPECKSHFLFGDGVMSLAHYRETDTAEIKQGLLCSAPPSACFFGSIQRCWASCNDGANEIACPSISYGVGTIHLFT